MAASPTNDHTAKRIVAAVIGNPNTGKSTLFNALTGINQKTGNYAGVTVEKKHGLANIGDTTIELIDLPGTYSLVARSVDEAIAVDVLASSLDGEEPVDVVLLVVDESSLERNLYLASQVLEFGLPVVVALTMGDIATKRGINVDARELTTLLGCPCVRVNALKGERLDELLKALAAILPSLDRHPDASRDPVSSLDSGFRRNDEMKGTAPLPNVEYPGRLRAAATELADELSAVLHAQGDRHTVSFQEAMRAIVDRHAGGEARFIKRLGDTVGPFIERARASLELGGLTPHMAEAGSRTRWARGMAGRVVTPGVPQGDSLTDRLDRVLTHRLWGTVIFLMLMALIFQSIYSWASPLMELIDEGFGSLGQLAGESIDDETLRSLVVDGVIAGIGGVLVFLPQIVILFLFISVLEASGYLARAAYLMDRLLRKFGLTGRSFIPMMSGFACAVPAIMATRTIPDRASRLATIMVTPLTSCSARLPVYTLMIGAFIPDETALGGLSLQALVMLGMYVTGILVAIPVAFVFRKTFFKGASAPLMIELPTYKLPRAKDILRAGAGRGWAFVKTAGTIIFITSVVLWAATYYPRDDALIAQFAAERSAAEASGAPEDDLAAIDAREQAALSEASYLGQAGRVIQPAVEPLGWDWRIASAAVASFPAREVVVSAMGVLFGAGGDVDEESEGLRETLQKATHSDGGKLFTIATALSLMVFFALCMQCAATLATIKRETNSWRWPVFAFTYMTVLAYLGALVTYQVAAAIGLD